MIDYLKLDVDYEEWYVLKNMILQKSLTKVRQLAVEIHVKEITGQKTSVKEFAKYCEILDMLEHAGFVRWRVDEVKLGSYLSKRTLKRRSCCYKLYFINTVFLKPSMVGH